MKYMLLAAFLICLPLQSYAQGEKPQVQLHGIAKEKVKTPEPKGRYIAFPLDFDKMSEAEKKQVGKDTDKNTEQYLHSPEYGLTLARFVKEQNPKGMNECAKLKMADTGNKIHIIEPLLWRLPDDLHPFVGKWEQTATFEGCDHAYSFTISATANKADVPELALKN